MVKVLVYLLEVKKKIKKRILKNYEECTGGGARTPTPLREMDFESIASTNSATPASKIFYILLINLTKFTYIKDIKLS